MPFKLSQKLGEDYPEFAELHKFMSGNQRAFTFNTRHLYTIFKLPIPDSTRTSVRPSKAREIANNIRFDDWLERFTEENRPEEIVRLTSDEKLQRVKEKMFIRAYVYQEQPLPQIAAYGPTTGPNDIRVMRVTPFKLAQTEVGWSWVPPYITTADIERALRRWEIEGHPGKYYASVSDISRELDLIILA